MVKEPRVNKVLARKRIDTTEEVIETMATITNQDIRLSHINFDYSVLGIDDIEKIKLIEIEKEVKFQEKQLGRVAFDIGRALNDAREIFIKSHSESFMEWYEALGLSKDQVSNFINRYKLSVDYPENKEVILGLTDKAIKESMNKKTSPTLLEKILKGQITSAAQIKKERENISNQFEKLVNEIEEAEIVGEDLEQKIRTQLDAIEHSLSRVKNSCGFTKENFEALLKVKGILDKME